MSTVTRQRHPLGLPAGSVRALLGLTTLALLWVLAWSFRPGAQGEPGATKMPLEFIYLQLLMLLILVHYFVAHGKTLGRATSDSSALWLPPGTVRFVLLAGYLGLAAFLYYNHSEYGNLPVASVPLLVGVLLLGFWLGHFTTSVVRAMSGEQLPYWYQDIQAWFALIAMIVLTTVIIIHVFINPNVDETMAVRSDLMEAILAGLVGWYYGARS